MNSDVKPNFIARILDKITSLSLDSYTPKSWHQKQNLFTAPEDSGFGYVMSPYNSIFNVMWGIPSNNDLIKYRQIYRTVPKVKRAIDKTVSSAINKGFNKFEFKNDVPNGDEIIEYLKGWVDSQPEWRTTLLTIGNDMILYGNAYAEIIYDDGEYTELEVDNPKNGIPRTASIPDEMVDWAGKGFIADLQATKDITIKDKTINEIKGKGRPLWLKPVDPLYMRVRGDAYGNVYGYLQFLSAPPVAFTADKIAHFRFNPKSTVYESFYGTSAIQSLIRTQEAIWSIENDLILISHTATKPPIHFACGSAEDVWGDEIFTDFQVKMSKRGAGGDVFSRGDVVATALPIPTQQMQQLIKNLEYHDTQRTIALGVPPQLLGQPEGSSRTTAEVSLDDWINTLQIIQTEISHVLEESVFRYVVEAEFGEGTPVPNIVWNSLFDKNENNEVTRIVSLKTAGIISLNEARRFCKDIGYRVEQVEGGDVIPIM